MFFFSTGSPLKVSKYPDMYDQIKERDHSLSIIFLLSFSILTNPSFSSTDSFIFAGCSQLKYSSDSTYNSNLNLLLTSIVTSAASLSYNNFTVVGSTPQTTISGLFQCRGDLDSPTCGRCVSDSVTRLGTFCVNSCGGVLQLDGCFVKYDNASFVGVEDKTEVVRKCGPSISYDSNVMSGYDAVMGGLGSEGGTYRVSGSGDFRGVAQCVGDLSASQCQDCLSAAIGRLRNDCGPTSSGDMFLAKCYARFSDRGRESPIDNDNKENGNEIDKTLAITIAIAVGVAFLILIISSLVKQCEKGKGGK